MGIQGGLTINLLNSLPEAEAKLLKIFVAEDNPADVVLLREVLQKQNIAHCLHVEGNGEAAIQFITAYRGRSPGLDLFILDVRMPRASGLDVAKSIRNIACFSTLPIVLMSSALSIAEEREIENTPFCFFFRKPLSFGGWCEMGTLIRTIGDEFISMRGPETRCVRSQL